MKRLSYLFSRPPLIAVIAILSVAFASFAFFDLLAQSGATRGAAATPNITPHSTPIATALPTSASQPTLANDKHKIADTVISWAWSPDGQFIAYLIPVQSEGLQGDLYVVDLILQRDFV